MRREVAKHIVLAEKVKTRVSEATEEVTQSRSRSEKLGEEVAGRRGTSAKRLGISAKR